MDKLSVEHQFQIASFKQQCKLMSREQAQDMLVSLYEAYLVQKVTFLELLKTEWGIEKVTDEPNKRPAEER